MPAKIRFTKALLKKPTEVKTAAGKKVTGKVKPARRLEIKAAPKKK